MLKRIAIPLAGALLLAGCLDDTQSEGERVQEGVMERATQQVPVPETSNFLTREQVAKWMRRQDVPNRMHYIYIFADTGQVIGYYVAQSRPVCTATFLTPPERTAGSGSRIAYQAPALDGVYYGKGGCDQWFFFDAETDALVELTGFKFFTSDQPLQLDAPALKVEAQ